MYQSIEIMTSWPPGHTRDLQQRLGQRERGGGEGGNISLLPGPLSIGLAPEEAKQSRMLSENPGLHRTTNCKTKLELVMLMSSASPMGIGPWAKQGNCKMSGVKLTISPRGGEIQPDKVSRFKFFFELWNPSVTCVAGTIISMSPLTVNKDHESTRGANWEKRANSLSPCLDISNTLGSQGRI